MSDDPRARSVRVATRAKGELERAQDIRLGAGGALVAGVFIGWAAIALKATLNEALGEETGYILLMAGAVLAAWFAGWIGGLTATIVAVVLNGAIFLGTEATGDAHPAGERSARGRRGGGDLRRVARPGARGGRP